MKLFKTTDEKIKDLGFIKEKEDRYGARYFRADKGSGFNHVVELMHKSNTCSICQSYDKDLTDERKIGNTCVGLSYREMKLFTKKMKELGFDKFTRI